jgi:ribose-phosphate pyrophosphokinase
VTAHPVVLGIPQYEYLQQHLVSHLGAEAGEIERKTFPDGERYQRIVTPLAERDVVIVGGTVDDRSTLAIFDLACAAVGYGARRLTLVMPYFGYSTMERATKPGEVVTAKTRARVLSAVPPASYGNRVLLLDPHSEGIPHYFEGGVVAVHVSGKPVLAPLIEEVGGEGFVLGSTDAGRAKWVQSLANDLGVESAFVIKRRISGSKTEIAAIGARVSGRSVVIYDDMIRTGGSLADAARAYVDAGASRVSAVCTHGVLPDGALERLHGTGLFASIACTDSHPRARELEGERLRVVSVAALFEPQLRA